MVQIWYRDDFEDSPPQDLHQTSPPRFLTTEELQRKTGVTYSKISDSVCDSEQEHLKLKNDQGCKSHDYLEIDRKMFGPEFETKFKKYYTEHMHKDSEIRLIIGGSGYFEVRDTEDKWVRILVEKGDLVNLPPGIFHRFTVTNTNYIKMFRLFSETPKWESVDRTAAVDHPVREEYREFMAQLV